jgi:hypothetical protein
VAKLRIRFKITSGNLETAHSCDCYKWIHHLAANRVKVEDLRALFNGKMPAGKLFVLDMLEYLRRSDDLLDRFLSGRGGIQPDDHLTMEMDAVRQLLTREFPDLVAQFAATEKQTKVIKRRQGAVDLSPLKELGKKS